MAAKLNEQERIEILMMIGYGDRARLQLEVCHLFNNLHPERPPINQSTVSRIEKKFREHGHVRDLPRTGRPKVNEDDRLNVMLDFHENPHKSSRAVAADHNVCQSSVSRVMKKHKWHPYKVVLVQELNEDDPDRRLQFSETMVDLLENGPLLLNNILFSDEASFYLNGTVNKQNCRYWAPTNPHWFIEHKTQYPQKVNVWAGIVGDRIVGPYFFAGTLTGALYLQFLQTELVPLLIELFPNPDNPDIPSNSLWFQQDGAPPHTTQLVRDYLNHVFPRRWIGRRGSVEWPARSPDMTPLDYFLWGYTRSQIYKQKPDNLDELKARIRETIRAISPEVLHKVLQEFRNRLAYCQEVGGGHFEQLL